mmetsp:Transcript_11808/g.46084  ORF Transcript_11808/g.46084 Transcript_11808/m.46084 type:complete len:283 (+) Transcript_11808:716-1564(+)
MDRARLFPGAPAAAAPRPAAALPAALLAASEPMAPCPKPSPPPPPPPAPSAAPLAGSSPDGSALSSPPPPGMSGNSRAAASSGSSPASPPPTRPTSAGGRHTAPSRVVPCARAARIRVARSNDGRSSLAGLPAAACSPGEPMEDSPGERSAEPASAGAPVTACGSASPGAAPAWWGVNESAGPPAGDGTPAGALARRVTDAPRADLMSCTMHSAQVRAASAEPARSTTVRTGSSVRRTSTRSSCASDAGRDEKTSETRYLLPRAKCACDTRIPPTGRRRRPL